MQTFLSKVSAFVFKELSAAEAENLGNFPMRKSILELIENQNIFNYPQERSLRRLITHDELIKSRTLQKIPRQTLEELLKLYCESGRLVAVPLFNNEITYVLPQQVKKVLKQITLQMTAEYSNKHPGSGASLDHIASKYSGFALDQLGSHPLAQTIRAYVALTHFQPDPVVMRFEHAHVLQAREMKILSARIADIVIIPTQATSLKKVSPRAAEQPSWMDLKKQYENEPILSILKRGLKILGVETIIRIAMREESYEELQNLIKSRLIFKKEHLEKIVECLGIIQNRNSISPNLQKAHQALWDYTESKMKPRESSASEEISSVKIDHSEKLLQLSQGIGLVLTVHKNRQIQIQEALKLEKVQSEMMRVFIKFLKEQVRIKIEPDNPIAETATHLLEEHFGIKSTDTTTITPISLLYYPQTKSEDFLIEKIKKAPDHQKLILIFEDPQFQVNSNLLTANIHASQLILELPEKLLLIFHCVFCENYCRKHDLDFTTSYLGFDPQVLKNTQIPRQQPQAEKNHTLSVKQLESLENPIIQMAARMKTKGFSKDILAEKLFEIVLENLKHGRPQINFLKVSQHAFRYLLNLEKRIAATPGNHFSQMAFVDDLKSGIITFWMRIIFSPECRHWDNAERGKFARTLIPHGQHLLNQFNKYEKYVRSQSHLRHSFEHVEDVLKILEEAYREAAPTPSLN